MATRAAIREQIDANWRFVATALPLEQDRLWLTFYISGDPSKLQRLAERMMQLGWSNLTGAEGGFLYPKIETRSEASIVKTTAFVALDLTEQHGVEIVIIDADNGRDVTRSEFVTLYREE
jgi:hypothetical protein